MSHATDQKPTQTAGDGAEFAHIDPRTLAIEANVRSQADLTEEFIDSIRQHGVLMPILVQRTSDGQMLVRAGQRRTLAAIEAGRETIPARIVDGDGDEARRLIEQITENAQRHGLRDADRVAGFQQLSLLGVSAAQIAKKTGQAKKDVTAALDVAKSKVATAVQGKYDLTLDQAAVIAGFEGDPEAIKSLTATAVKNPGQFAHEAQRLRDEREKAAKRATVVQALADAGVRQVPAPGYDDKSVGALGDLMDAGGKVLDPEAHKGCPGHAAYVRQTYGSKDDFTTVYVCDAWRGKHKTLRTTPSGTPMDAEAAAKAKAERVEVLENNAAWRSAETVRREWLAEFAKRKTTPKDAATFIAAALATDADTLQKAYYDGHALAAEWLGVAGAIGSPGKIRDLIAKASPARAQHIALVIVLGAIEARTGVHTWRMPGHEADYLTALETWGYSLAPVEQIARGPVAKPEPRPNANPSPSSDNAAKVRPAPARNAPTKAAATKAATA